MILDTFGLPERKQGRPKTIKLGDYCLITRWPDARPEDPYFWGFLDRIHHGEFY